MTMVYIAFTSLLCSVSFPATAGDTPENPARIHLDQYNGYFSAQGTLAGLKPGVYEFVVTNKAGKPAGFQLQDENRMQLDMFPLNLGKHTPVASPSTKAASVTAAR